MPIKLRPGHVSSSAAIEAIEPKRLFQDIGCRFGTRLRDLRRSRNLTQVDMAVAFGIDRSYISDIECGKKGISLATLEVIAIGFQIPLEDLLRDL